MAKKQAAKPADPSENVAGEAPTGGSEKQVDESPKVRKAADAVRRAEAELEKAQQLFHKVRQETTDRLKGVREKSLGDLVDGTLNLVKKHPGPGVIVAALIGFFLGRLFRR